MIQNSVASYSLLTHFYRNLVQTVSEDTYLYYITFQNTGVHRIHINMFVISKISGSVFKLTGVHFFCICQYNISVASQFVTKYISCYSAHFQQQFYSYISIDTGIYRLHLVRPMQSFIHRFSKFNFN